MLTTVIKVNLSIQENTFLTDW